MNELFSVVSGSILKEKPADLEIAGFEDKDIMLVQAVAITEGVNGNDALFERSDLHKSYQTLVGKPVKIRFAFNNPTGHGLDRDTGKFDELVRAVGVVYDTQPQILMPDGEVRNIWGSLPDEDDEYYKGGQYRIVVTMGIWQKYYPEIALRMRQLHDEDDLNFSIEAERDVYVTSEGYRKCYNITFNGLAVVKTPAFEDARSLVVAELLDKDNTGGNQKMDYEKMYQELSEKHNTLVGEKALADQEIASLQEKVSTLGEQVATKDGELKTVVAERDSYKSTVEVAEKAKLGAERLEKLTKYGEVTKTADELAELTKEQFVDELAEMVEKYVPADKEEHAELQGQGLQGGAYHSSAKPAQKNRKQSLMELAQGLAD